MSKEEMLKVNNYFMWDLYNITESIYFIFKAINQPNSNYVKLPGATFCDELPLNEPSPRSKQTFTEASKFLECYDRQIRPILGDGNCLFRALSYLLCGQEDHHQQIRHTLVDFTTTNSSIFSKYCTLDSFEEHTSRMKYETVWGTDLELRAASSYFQIPIYVCTQRSKTHYWECYRPLPALIPLKEYFFSDMPQTKALDHLEICHRNRCHYDVVIMSDGLRPVYPPQLQNTSLYLNLT